MVLNEKHQVTACGQIRGISHNRDTPLNSNYIVITNKTMGKYSKIVDDLQYRVDNKRFVME